VLTVLCLLSPATTSLVPPAHAADAEPRTRQVQALRERVFQALAKAQELLDANDYGGALRELERVRGIDDLNSYERGQILYFTGLVAYQQDNVAGAIRAFEQVVALPDLPEGFRADTIWALVQLAMAGDQYRKVIEYGNQWLRTVENPTGDPYYLLAVAHFQLTEYRKTVEMMDRAIGIVERDGAVAREEWYGLLRAALHELNDVRRLRSVLEQMVARWPKKEYWVHLSAVYGELDEDAKQIAALETVYEAGWIDRENELLQLAQLYMLQGGAYKGARLIEKGMESGLIQRNEQNYRTLAQAWMQAQDDDRSIAPLREAAQRADDGQAYLQLAQSYLNLYRYDDCIDAARSALDRGGLSRPDVAHMVRGSCLLELQRYQQAREAFAAARADARSRVAADRWIDFIDREVVRRQDIERQLARLEGG
jgi:tetratricopeptide (TPR) repeat protein